MLLPRMDGPHQLLYWRMYSIFSRGGHPWRCCGRTTRYQTHKQTGYYVVHYRHTQTPWWVRYWWAWDNYLHTPWFPRARAWEILWPAHLTPLGPPLSGGCGNAHGRSGVSDGAHRCSSDWVSLQHHNPSHPQLRNYEICNWWIWRRCPLNIWPHGHTWRWAWEGREIKWDSITCWWGCWGREFHRHHPFSAALRKEKVLVVKIVRLILFAAILSHCVISLPLTLFRLFTFTHHLSFALSKGTIWWT